MPNPNRDQLIGDVDLPDEVRRQLGQHSMDFEGDESIADPLLKAGISDKPIFHPLGVTGRIAQATAGALMARRAAREHSASAANQAGANAALEQGKMRQQLQMEKYKTDQARQMKEYEEGQTNRRQDKTIAEQQRDRDANRELTRQQREEQARRDQEEIRHHRADEERQQKESERRYGPGAGPPGDTPSSPKPQEEPDLFPTDKQPKGGVMDMNQLRSGADIDRMRQSTGRGMTGGPPSSSDEIAARGSWFGQHHGKYDWRDPGDKPGSAASGLPDEVPGIALPTRKHLGEWFDVTGPNGKTIRVRQTDVGPNPRTGRGVDINASAAEKMGYNPRNFPTDASFKYRPAGAPETGPVLAGTERPYVRGGMAGSPPTPNPRPSDMGGQVPLPQRRPPPIPQPRPYDKGFGPPIIDPKTIAAEAQNPGNQPGTHIATGPKGEKIPIEYHPENPGLQRLGRNIGVAETPSMTDASPPRAGQRFAESADPEMDEIRRLWNGNEADRTAARSMLEKRMQRQNEGRGSYAREEGTNLAKRRDRMDESAGAATDELPQLNMLKRLMADKDFYSGWQADNFSAMSGAAKALGIGNGRLKVLLDFASKLGAAGSLKNIEELGQSGAVRVPEMNLVKESNFNKNLTPEANAAVVEIRSRLAQRQIDIANAANIYEKAHGGQIDRGFYQKVREHFRDHPLFTDDEMDHYNELLKPKGKEGAETEHSQSDIEKELERRGAKP